MSSYPDRTWLCAAASLLLLILLCTSFARDDELNAASGAITRVLLVSSVVDDAKVLAEAAAEDVLVIRYDAETSSLDDLLSLVRERLAGSKAGSIGIAAHDYGSAKFYLTGEQTIGLGSTLNNEEQRQFWRGLGSMIAEGGRIDLFACRLASTPEGQILVSQLSGLSGVVAAASTNETGNPAAAGDWVLETAGIDAGTVYFDDDRLSAFSGLLSSEFKKLTALDAAAQDMFGFSVAVSGDIAIVGANWDDDAFTAAGSAYIFARDQGGSNNWGQVKKLTASDPAILRFFGCSVGISGDTAVVGSRSDIVTSESGSAYIFSRNQDGANNWGEVKKLTASDAVASDFFGCSVAISDDFAVVGAYGNDSAGVNSGSAYIFARNHDGADNWGEVKKLTASDADAGDLFGYSVAISGDYAIVGAANNDDAGSDSGSAYIFGRNQGGADNWGQVKKLTASDAGAGDRFGGSVAVSGDIAAVGAMYNDDFGSDSGSAYIFSRNHGGTDNWGEIKKLIASDPGASDNFGTSVAVSGDIAVIGAQSDEDAGFESGSAYIFSRNFGGADSWGQADKLTASDAGASDNFGYSVAVSGGVVVAGAINDDDAGTSSGSAYVFHIAVPALSSPTATGVSYSVATLGATVTSYGSSSIIERGVVWSTTPNPTITNFAGKAATTGTLGVFTVPATGLSPGTTYYYRGYATNPIGTGYSPEGTFTTLTMLLGSLQVTLAPQTAVTAGAQWRIEGQSVWRNSGETVYGIPVGSITVEFKPVESYLTPANISALIQANQTTFISAEYKWKGGSVTVKLFHVGLRRAGAAWRLQGFSSWLRSGASADLPLGTHTLEFKPVPGWIALPLEVKVNQDDEILLSVWYQPFLVSDCSDYEGNDACDCALWRPSDSSWLVHEGMEKRFGEAGVWPTPGDYDGDGKVDLAYWHPVKGLWRIRGGSAVRNFGEEGDIPVPGDYDGDGLTDPALYRPATGEWFIHESSSSTADARHLVLGGGGDHIPVPGDYDGDGATDPAVYSVKSGLWHVAFQIGLKEQRVFRISLPAPSNAEREVAGGGGLIPAPADYDGDGTTDIALVDLKKGIWRVKDQFSLEIKCKAGDIPVPGDYDGDGAFEPALYRPKKGTWFFADGSKVKHGGKDDIPLVRGR